MRADSPSSNAFARARTAWPHCRKRAENAEPRHHSQLKINAATHSITKSLRPP